jgi:hypothetical protein
MVVKHTLGDGRTVKLGKRPAKHDIRTLQLSKYTQQAELPPPTHENWARKVQSWPMMKNDNVGDCTCACAGHMIEQWTTYAADPGNPSFTPSDSQIIDAYSEITGYDPQTGSHDDGAVILDVLNYWRKTGIAGRTIIAFASVDPRSQVEIEDSVYLFGNCYLGVQLPVSAQDQSVWAVPPGGPVGPGAPGSWGGHAIPVVAYNRRGLSVITWGATKRMTWGFLSTYADEAYAVVSQDWISKVSNVSASGFDLATLETDLSQIGKTAAGAAA